MCSTHKKKGNDVCSGHYIQEQLTIMEAQLQELKDTSSNIGPLDELPQSLAETAAEDISDEVA